MFQGGDKGVSLFFLFLSERLIDMKYKAVLFKDLADTGKDYLRSHDCDVFVSSGKTEDDFIKDMDGADALFVRNDPVTARMMDSDPKLKVIAKHGIGYDNIDVQAATERNIQVVFAPTGNVCSVAEHAMFFILACARRYNFVSDQFKHGNYDIRFTLSDAHDISGKTLGLIGFGKIAAAVAHKAKHGFDMKVIAYDPCADKIKNDDVEFVGRDEVFERSDYVSIHVPSLPSTKHSIGMDEFKKMKPSAFIINTSRGDIIRENELIKALEDRIIDGAALDVFEKEPVTDSPLLHMDNVIATPHTAGMTVEASDRLSLTGAEGIIETLYGLPISHPVNKVDISLRK